VLEIERDEQLADLAHQRADDRFLGGAHILVFGELARDLARQERAVQFELRVDTARRALMKVIDEL
jgi:hypothetical protein